jgi:hypothetical protein
MRTTATRPVERLPFRQWVGPLADVVVRVEGAEEAGAILNRCVVSYKASTFQRVMRCGR